MLDGTHLGAGHVALNHQLSHDAGLPPPRLLDQWDVFPLQIELFVNMHMSFKTVVQIPWISVISSHNPAHYPPIPQFSMAIYSVRKAAGVSWQGGSSSSRHNTKFQSGFSVLGRPHLCHAVDSSPHLSHFLLNIWNS